MDNTICRLCLASISEISDSNCIALWTTSDKTTPALENSIIKRIEEHICIQLQERPNLSNIICKSCEEKLDNWIAFKTMCYRNNDYLMSTSLNEEHVSSEDESYNDNDSYIDDDSYINHLLCETAMETNDSDDPECSLEKDQEDEEDLSNPATSVCTISPRQLGGKQLKCKDCKKVMTNIYKFVKHSCYQGKEKLECPDCPQICKDISELENHLKYHKYSCPVCHKIYSRSYLWEHFPSHWDKFRCKICLRSFQTNHGLREHMRAVHSGTRNFVCEECGRSFSTKPNLEVHQKTHNRDVTYKCDQCEYSSNMRKRLAAHKRWRHAPVDGEPKFTCETCGKRFTQRQRLLRHVSRVHNGRPHECHICGHRTSTKSNLKIHLNGKSPCSERIAAQRLKREKST